MTLQAPLEGNFKGHPSRATLQGGLEGSPLKPPLKGGLKGYQVALWQFVRRVSNAVEHGEQKVGVSGVVWRRVEVPVRRHHPRSCVCRPRRPRTTMYMSLKDFCSAVGMTCLKGLPSKWAWNAKRQRRDQLVKLYHAQQIFFFLRSTEGWELIYTFRDITRLSWT